ncbi:MAG: hypothetical protein AAF821_07725 [Cyanobacteria bacterium P01_D01_bin.156]
MGNVAILFGIPIHEASFLSRVAESDYLRLYRSSLKNRDEYDKYIAEPFRDMATQVDQHSNFEVRTGATLKDLQEVSKTANVIIVVSHWKNYGFSNNDIIRPVNKNSFAKAASQSDDPLAQWLAHRLNRHLEAGKHQKSTFMASWLDSIRNLWRTELTLRDILEQALDVPLENELPQIEEVSQHVESDLTRRTRRRRWMDMLFANLVLPGNRLELFDGLHNSAAIAQSIDKSFNGVLDLTACTSTALADYISNYHQYRFRVVQFSENQEPVWAATVLKITLKSLLGYRDPADSAHYLDARQHAIQLTRQTLQSRWLAQHKKKNSRFLGGKLIMALKAVLSRQASQWQQLGGEPVRAINALFAYKKSIVKQLLVKTIVSSVLLAGAAYLAITLFSDQSALAVVIVAIFPIASGLITDLFGTWKELHYSNLLLLLIQDANDEQIKDIIDTLLDKL